MSVLANSNAIEVGGYNISNSLRFRRSATAFLQRTPASVGNRKTFTFSAWVKRGLSGNNVIFQANQNSSYGQFAIQFSLNTTDDIGVYNQNSTTNILTVGTNAVFRDFSAWYHIVVAVDTTQATAANRVLIYVNGVLQSTTISVQVSQNTDLNCNNTIAHNIGKEQTASGGSANYLDGYLAEVNFIDGQALTASSFGATDVVTGVWAPKKYTGTYGTNGFYLNFSDIATTSGSNAGLGKDFSGNTNYWTTNNISVTSGTTYDAMKDSPTLTSATVANYAVLNPLMSGTPFQTNAAATVSQGNLQVDWTTTGQGSILSTIAITSGKWYFEGTVTGTNTREVIGIVNSSAATTTYVGGDANGWGYFSVNGQKYNNGSATSYGATYTTNDIIGVAFDADAGSLTFYKNGTSQGTAFTGLSAGTYFFAVADANSSLTCGWNVNFGQRPFAYTPPTGFLSVNTYNLPDSTIKKGNSYMDATTYTGNGSTLSVTNAGSFKPDAVWLKCRSTARNHNLFDSNRGVTKRINTNLTDVEDTASGVTAFNSNGFTLGSNTVGNTNADTYVAWQWQAGQGTNTTNTAGSITSTVSVNATAGFSIVTYTGTGSAATIGHGLGVAPKMVIVKNRVQGTYGNWTVWQTSLTGSQYLELNGTTAASTNTNRWNGTTPTSTVFSVGTDSFGNTNKSGDTYVAYCWAEIVGFSKFGSYTGNGSTDGPFVYLGFRPKYLMIKRTNTTGSWLILDSVRETYNVEDYALYANVTDTESFLSAGGLDFVSNGFKLRGTDSNINTSGSTMIYVAFAENPFKNALAR